MYLYVPLTTACQDSLQSIIPDDFNNKFNKNIMLQLFTKVEKVTFCKVVRIIGENMIIAKRTSR